MKRRSFISKTTLGISGITLASSSVASLVASCSNNNKTLELAVLGCNTKGISLITRAFQNIPDVTIKSIFDFDKEKCNEAGQAINQSLKYLPEQAQDMAGIFNDKKIDGVFIFLPEHWRALATIQACEAGKDVYVESLPSHSISESKLMTETAKKRKRVIQCGFLHRSAPSVLSAKAYIEEGNMGQIVHVKVFSLNKNRHQLMQSEMNKPVGLDWDNWLGPIQNRPYRPAIYSHADTEGWKAYSDFTSGRMSEAGNGLDLARMLLGNAGHPFAVFGYETNFFNNAAGMIPDRQIVTWDFEHLTMTCEAGNSYNYMSDELRRNSTDENITKWLLNGNRVEVYGTDGLMYIDTGRGSWQVQGEDGKILKEINETEKGTSHVMNFIGCMRSRNLPAGNMMQGHLSATLAHLGNIACRSGNKQLVFDKNSETFINDEKANTLLRPAYRK